MRYIPIKYHTRQARWQSAFFGDEPSAQKLNIDIFKLADRMRSMRTNGASKNPDWPNQNGGDL